MKLRLLLSLFVASAVLALASCSSCSGNKSKVTPAEEANAVLNKPDMVVTGDDSAMVIDLVKEYFNLVQHKKYTQAMAMIYYLDKDQKIVTPPKALYDKELAAISAFTIYGYDIDFLKFYKETDSEVKYTIYLQDPKKVAKPATMSGMLRPVRRDAKWYLTMADAVSEQSPSELDN